MDTNTNQLAVVQESGAFSPANFEHAQRIAKMLATSTLVPQTYQGRVDNCLVALEMSNRIGASPLMVMQNMHVIQGKPSWSSAFIIATINSCGRFTPLKFRKSGTGEQYGYEAYSKDKASGEELVGPKVTWEMVKAEGWFTKAGSKWKTMPELMFQYRAAAFFGRLYVPEIMMGMQTMEEVIDVTAIEPKIDKEMERITLMIKNAGTLEELQQLEKHVPETQLDLFNERVNELKQKTKK